MSDINSSPALKRSFGMREAVTITAGSVIGVGLFTVGSNIVGLMGPSVIFATIVALLISVYPALLYAEMGAALPYAGGTYQFASVGIGRAAGVLAGWNFIISLVAESSADHSPSSLQEYLKVTLVSLVLAALVTSTIT